MSSPTSSGRHIKMDNDTKIHNWPRLFSKLIFNFKFIIIIFLLVTFISFFALIRGKYPLFKNGDQMENLARQRHAGIRPKANDYFNHKTTKKPKSLRTLAPDIKLAISQCPNPGNPSTDLLSSIRTLDDDPACKKALFSAACQLEKSLLYDSALPVTCSKDAKSKNAGTVEPKILFVIDVNSGGARQVERMLMNIYREKHFYLLLIANCFGPAAERLRRLQSLVSNIQLLFYDVQCPDNGVTEVNLPQTPETWRTVIENSTRWDWNYLLSLDAFDFPLLNIDKLTLFLENHSGTNFLESYHIDQDSDYVRNISTSACMDGRRWPIGRGNPPMNVAYFQGPPWYLLTKEFLDYALFSNDQLASGLRKFSSLTPFPAQLLFHTLAHNGRFCHTFVNESLRLTKFHIFDQRSRDVNRRGPITPQEQEQLASWTFTPKDFVYLTNLNGQKFFARRFDPIVNQQMINDVQSILDDSKKFSVDTPGLHSYWQTLWTSRVIDKRKSTLRYAAVARLLGDLCLKRLKRCRNLSPKSEKSSNYFTLNELSLFRDFDLNDGLILSFNITCSEDDRKSSISIPVECFVNFLHHEKVKETATDMTDLRNELLHLRVGSDYDFMDDTFRNYIGSVMIDTNEQFGLRTQWIPGEMGAHYQFAWLDPKDFVAGTTFANVGPWTTTHFQPKAEELQYLNPGVWTAVMLFDGRVTAASEFLVLPESEQAYERVDMKDKIRWGKRFYEINRLCVRDSYAKRFTTHCSCNPPPIPSCERTTWSTLAPDPKSNFILYLKRKKHRS